MSVEDLRKEFDAATKTGKDISSNIFALQTGVYIIKNIEFNDFQESLDAKWIPRSVADKALLEVKRLEKENENIKSLLDLKQSAKALKMLCESEIVRGLTKEIKELQGQLEEKEKQIENLKKPCYQNGVDPCWVPKQLKEKEKNIEKIKDNIVATIKLRKESEDAFYKMGDIEQFYSYQKQREDLEYCLNLLEELQKGV